MKNLFLCILLLSLFFSCQQTKKSTAFEKVNILQLKKLVDTLHPQKTYNRLKFGYDENVIDSIYQPFLEKLNYQFKNQLAIQHANYYQLINQKNYKSQIFALFAKSNAYYFIGEYQKSIECARKQIQLSINHNYEDELAQIYDNLADFEQVIGNETSSLKARLKALKIAEKQNDKNRYYSIKYGLATNYQRQENWKKAIQNMKDVLDFHIKSNAEASEIASDNSFLGGLYCSNNQLDSALLYSSLSEKQYAKINNIYGKSECYNNLGLIYFKLKQYDKALKMYNKSLSLAVKPSTINTTLYNRGNCYLSANNFIEAETDLKKVLESIKSNEFQALSQKCYYALFKIESSKNNPKKALEYHLKYSSVNDSIKNSQKTNYINELLITYENDKKNKEIKLLQKQKTVEKEKATILLLILILVTLSFLFLYFRNQKNRQLLIAKNKIQEIEIENFTKKIIYKNSIIDELNSELTAENIDSTFEVISEIERLTKMKILTENDWEQFQVDFEKIFPHLIFKIKQKITDLSAAELRLFLLIKLKISTKDIASILGISSDSVKKSRYRLKKKLAIDENISLDDFVLRFK